MKNTIITVLTIIVCTCSAVAQFSVTNAGGYSKLSEKEMPIDAVIIFNGIDLSTTITYIGQTNSMEWRWAINGESFSSNQRDINPDHATLYHVYQNGKRLHSLYTIDYKQTPATLNDLTVTETDALKCETIELLPDITVSDFVYTDSLGTQHTLPRYFALTWGDAVWNGTEWIDTIRNQTGIVANRLISVPAPMKSTTFKLYESEFSAAFGIESDTITTDYTAVASRNQLLSTVIEREYKNEKDRSSETAIEGSAPLNVEFTSNANPLDITYYEWIVTSTDDPGNYKRYNDKDLNYFFEETGEYNVRLTTSSGACECTDSVNIKVLESYLEAPNVFTPNGDGMNDEWRVAYRSIASYQCIIQNRWGRTVFKSDNPGRGWDGTINGRPAAEGTYYYVIVAYGTDLNIKGKPVKYKLSGDINLLR